MPFVSVVIPCYNGESYIEKCLKALENQSFSDFNVILVDDCSTDNTEQVVDAFCASSPMEVLFVRNEENSGPARSRNRGIALSKAEYIAFCDSDDWYEPDYLEKMTASAKENHADIVFCNSQKVLMDGTIIPSETLKQESAPRSVREALVMGVDSLWSMLIKREIISGVPQPDLRNGEDMAVIPLLIMRAQRFGLVKDTIYNYLCRPGSLSLSASKHVVSSIERSFAHIMENRAPGFDAEVEFIGIKNVVYGALLNHFKYSKDTASAKEILGRFEKSFPNWEKNLYMGTLAIYKRVFVKLAKARCFVGVKLLCQIHKWMTEKKENE